MEFQPLEEKHRRQVALQYFGLDFLQGELAEAIAQRQPRRCSAYAFAPVSAADNDAKLANALLSRGDSQTNSANALVLCGQHYGPTNGATCTKSLLMPV